MRKILCWLGLHTFGDGICLPPDCIWGDDDPGNTCQKCGKDLKSKPFILWFISLFKNRWKFRRIR